MGEPGRIQWPRVDMVATDEMMRSYTETQLNRLLAIFASDFPAEFLEALHTLERRERLEAVNGERAR